MAPVVRLHRLVWGGRLFTDESWSCSLHFNSPDTASATASDYTAALIAWMGRASSWNSAQAKLDFVKLNIINPVTAKYLFPVSNTHDQLDMGVGTKAPAPGQNTIAVSTRTALARGRGHAGRFYPPTGDAALHIGGDGAVGGGVAEGMSVSAAQLITDLNAVDPELTAVVFSKIGQSVEVITGVQVGHVVDTMRSRRGSLKELPAFSAVT